jgi:hypothetical protein
VDVLDGNAIAGDLFGVFGRDVTTMTGSCEGCGKPSMVGELVVYLRAPGKVARCPHCGAVVMVLIQIAEATHLHMEPFHLHESPGQPPASPS